MLTKYISNSERIRADLARMDWSNAVHAHSLRVQKNWTVVRAQSKNVSDWIGLDLDRPGPYWIIAGLVESLIYVPLQQPIYTGAYPASAHNTVLYIATKFIHQLSSSWTLTASVSVLNQSQQVYPEICAIVVSP